MYIYIWKHKQTHKRGILSFLIMVYIESWDDFVEKSVQMFRSDPEKVQFLQLNYATFVCSRYNAISFIFLFFLRLWRMSFYCADSLCHEIQALRRQIDSEGYRWYTGEFHVHVSAFRFGNISQWVLFGLDYELVHIWIGISEFCSYEIFLWCIKILCCSGRNLRWLK